jgi:drug/metabolite transporter (DMT)-like permease
LVGIWYWEPMTRTDWMWMGTLCVTGALGHWLLIKAYEMAEASTVQPFAFFQLVFVSILGLSVFGEVLRPNVAIGVAIILAAGIFTVLRARRVNAT